MFHYTLYYSEAVYFQLGHCFRREPFVCITYYCQNELLFIRPCTAVIYSVSASEVTYVASGGALNSTHSLIYSVYSYSKQYSAWSIDTKQPCITIISTGFSAIAGWMPCDIWFVY